jgi:hypothetical protein
VNDLAMARRVGHAMRKLGWIRKRERTGARGYYYVPGDAPEPSPEPVSRPDAVPF